MGRTADQSCPGNAAIGMANNGQTIRLEFSSAFEMLDLVQIVSDAFGRLAGLDEEHLHWISVAIRESVINAIKHGNRSDARWVTLADAAGRGLLVRGVPTINFSAHRFTTMDLEKARHTCELRPRDEITLNLDYRHNGLGSGSCGPGPWPQYLLHPEEFRFAVRLLPFSVDEAPAGVLARRELPTP